nr:tail fiber assembly protein [Serratia sp. PAMC26656]
MVQDEIIYRSGPVGQYRYHISKELADKAVVRPRERIGVPAEKDIVASCKSKSAIYRFDQLLKNAACQIVSCPSCVRPPHPPRMSHLHSNFIAHHETKSAGQISQVFVSNIARRISPLQDAVDLNVATEQEKKKLIEWKHYRVALSRIETKEGADINWPKLPE